MKKMILFIAIVAAIVAMGFLPTKVANTRDYAYEAYCDSLWESNPDYYMDVLAESDEYCVYIAEHGKWWGE